MGNEKKAVVLLLVLTTLLTGNLAAVLQNNPAAYAAQEKPLKFEVRFVPTKLIEKTESKIEIVPLKGGKVFPQKIEDLTVTSQNPDILKIVEGSHTTEGFATTVKIETVKQGKTTISLAAPGFESSEFPVTVHHNNRNEKKIVIKALPDKFSINGPNKGYLAVELLDEDGIPIIARDDITVSLTTSNNKIIDLAGRELVIEKGNYYAIEEFSINSFDDSVIVYASAPNVETAETEVEVVSPTKPFQVKLFVAPDRASRSSITNSYAVVQLQDANGNPIRATEDIPVSIKISDPFGSDIKLNDRGRIPQISPSSTLVIKKGDYWDATKLVTNAGIVGEYEVGISAKGYDVSESKTLEIVESELVEDRNVVFDPVPSLAIGGEEELVGIVHLEDDDENLLLANENLEFRIFSSDEDAMSIKKVQIERGQISAAVYAKLGYVKPDSLNLHEAFENKELSPPAVFGPREVTLKLVAEPLVSKIMSNSNLPLVTYVTKSDGSSWYFPYDTDIFFSPSDLLDTAPQFASMGSGPIIMEAFSTKEGSETLLVQSGTLSTEMKVENHKTTPSKMELDMPSRVFAGLNNMVVAQILDNEGKPIFANSDIQIKVISNDKSVVDVTKDFMIKRGESYSAIDIEPLKKGTAELAVLATGFPLTKKTITVDELKPDIKFDSPSIVDPNSSFASSILVTMDGNPLRDMDVSWDVQGATVQERQSTTDSTGKSTVLLLSGNKTINLSAQVSNEMFPSTTSKKTIKINSTLIDTEPTQQDTGNNNKKKIFEVFGIDLFLIIVPLAIVTSGIVIKKKGLMKLK